MARDKGRERWNAARREMERMAELAEQARCAFLRAAGWQLTCEIGCCWLWKRGTNPPVYLATDAAIALTLREGYR